MKEVIYLRVGRRGIAGMTKNLPQLARGEAMRKVLEGQGYSITAPPDPDPDR